MFNPFASTLLRRHSSSATEIEEFFHSDNPGCLRELLAFAINEFAPENILAYMACADYARRPTREKMQLIQTQFIAANAQFETNIPNAVRLQFKQSSHLDLSQAQYRMSGTRRVIAPTSSLPPDANYFKTANYDIELMRNIADTYSRFSLIPGTIQHKLGQTFIGHVTITAATGRVQVMELFSEMKRVGFNVPAKLLNL